MSLVRCTRCVMPTTRPDTAFVDGVCSACVAYEQRQATDWGARLQDLYRILTEAKATPGPYDCIVPSSGGKDSTYQVLTLLELGAHPLVVTATTCHLTEIGRANIKNLAHYATTIEVTPNRCVRAQLNRIGLETVGDPSWPEHASIFTTPFRLARRLGIRHIFYGESPQNQYGGPPGTEQERRMTARWIHEHGGLLGLRADDLAAMTSERAMDDYRMPADASLVEAYFLGQFLPWDSHHNAERALAAGLQDFGCPPTPANWWRWENLDNAQTGLHDHLMYRKYGYGRGCAQLAVDVRAGRVSRDFALEWIRANDGLFPSYYAAVSSSAILEQMGVSRAHLDEILDRFTNWELFRGQHNRRPILKD